MIASFLEGQIKENFSFPPTPDQENVLKRFSDFLFSPSADGVFVLRGYAGTGKTSLVAALVKTLDALKQRVVLMAPTGWAAKVFAAYAGHPAFTIHKRIYRQRTFSPDMTGFAAAPNLSKRTLYIVDEASMIANDGYSGSAFGTGRLLDDLVHFVYSAEGCRLLLVGDTAQLPPVGEDESPALDTSVLQGYGLEVTEADLTQVVRQAEGSGILWNATALRRLIVAGDCAALPRLRVSGFADIRVLPGDELIETLGNCYDADGLEETIVICRSNKRANIYNNGIRAQVLWREEELESGDLIMVARNNYYWGEKTEGVDFLANGELAVVRRVRNVRQLYGFRFATVELTFPDCGEVELEANLLLDALHTDAPALPRADVERLCQSVLEDYADIGQQRERMKRLKQDPYYNALQAKYAYAVTCHKAQGGQWRNVFLDQGYLSAEQLTPDYFRWLYTAFTRATGTLYLVNYPADKIC